jgi:MFS family permease
MTSAARRTGVVIGLGTAQTLAWASTYYLPAILAVPMARDLRVPPSWVFGAFSVGLVISALLGPASGRAIDAHGGRPVLVFSSLIFAAGLALLGLSNITNPPFVVHPP